MIPVDDKERIERLRSAEMMLNDAAEIIDECTRMTEHERRFGHLSDDIRRIASSNEGDSLENLIREVEYSSEEQPGWTRPLASVKNTNRKDI